MANVEQAIYARLSSFTGLTDLVNSKIFPVIARQGEQNPLVVFNLISQIKNHAMGVDISPTEASVQISVFSDEGANCLAIANQVEAALSRYRGDSGGVTVQDIFLESVRADYESDTKEHRRDLDFRVFFEE
jgi:hypothetical protein